VPLPSRLVRVATGDPTAFVSSIMRYAYMEDFRFTESARRHRISRERALYVLHHYVWAFDVGDGMTLHVGPDRGGVDLEVGTVAGRGGGVYVVHVMKLRTEFEDEYWSRLPWRR
jgi:hypothetical protein